MARVISMSTPCFFIQMPLLISGLLVVCPANTVFYSTPTLVMMNLRVEFASNYLFLFAAIAELIDNAVDEVSSQFSFSFLTGLYKFDYHVVYCWKYKIMWCGVFEIIVSGPISLYMSCRHTCMFLLRCSLDWTEQCLKPRQDVHIRELVGTPVQVICLTWRS